MKLHLLAGSPNSRKVLAVVNQLELDIELVYKDLLDGELKAPNFLKVNPNGMVPVLEDSTFVLNESNAINTYLCDFVGNDSLFPSASKDRADINRWLFWETAHYNNAFGLLSWESVAKPLFMGVEGNPVLIDYSKEKLAQFASVLEQHLADREFMVGSAKTIADYAIIHVEFFKEQVPFDWTPYPALNGYYDRMRKDVAWLATAVAPEDMGRAKALS